MSVTISRRLANLATSLIVTPVCGQREKKKIWNFSVTYANFDLNIIMTNIYSNGCQMLMIVLSNYFYDLFLPAFNFVIVLVTMKTNHVFGTKPIYPHIFTSWLDPDFLTEWQNVVKHSCFEEWSFVNVLQT